MKKPQEIKIARGCLAVIFVIILGIVNLGCSWLCMCGIIKLITMCFRIKFSWTVTTAIWLIFPLVRRVFRITIRKEKCKTYRRR